MLTVTGSLFSQIKEVKSKSDVTASHIDHIEKHWNHPNGIWLKFIDGEFFYVFAYDDCPVDVDTVGFYIYKFKIYGEEIFYLNKLLIGYVPYPNYYPYSRYQQYPDVYYPNRVNGNQTMATIEKNNNNVLIKIRYGNRMESDSLGIPYKKIITLFLSKDNSDFGYSLKGIYQ